MDPRNTYLSQAKRYLNGSTSGTGTASSVLDKGWLVAPRYSSEYKLGVNNFIQFAMTNSERNSMILCPCKTCGNRYWLAQKQVNEHLICEGFMNGYSTWIFHGETPGMVDNYDASDGSDDHSDEEEFADTDEMSQMLMDGFGMYDNTNLDENEEDDEGSEEEDVDAEGYAQLVNDGGKELYTGCKAFSKLHFLVRMMNIKKLRRVSNCIFDDYLSLFREALPEGHNLPRNFYEAKKYIRKIGLGYDTVHACKNDCVLFKGIHANADECPKCHVSRWKSIKPGIDGKRINKVPQKVARHFKLKKRIQRLFSSSDVAPNMRWHAEGRTKDGMMRHPADSPAWKSFDVLHKTFAAEPRNIRFGLATDGFNPFKTMNLTYSIWPILLIPYNLPPWICLKQSNVILSVIVPGKKSPGKEMDVYMQLVIDELLVLWNHGVLTHDASFGKKFRLYAALLWTISDWQGRGIISGESISACSHCLIQTSSRRLKHGQKTCFMGHRRFLSANHEFRQDAESFDGTVENRDALVQLTGKAISKLTKHMVTDYGKLQKSKKLEKKRKRGVDSEGVEIEGVDVEGEYIHTVESTFRKRSAFFQLPYWKTLLVRHNLDAMHIEKNVFENIAHTLLDVDSKSKDSVNARLDLKQWKIRNNLHADMSGPKPVIPKALYYMSPEMRKIFCKLIGDTRFPDGHASNLEHKVQNGKLNGLKSHDCHIIMQELLPLAMSRTLPENVTRPLMGLCNYFKMIYAKVIHVKEMQRLEENIPEILCQLEKIFPPAFFDIMVHLTIHLATEVRLAGPVQYRAMWFTERYMGKMKGSVNCRSHPEGAIAEAYVFDESLTFCSRYLRGNTTEFNRPACHEDNHERMKEKYLVVLGRPMSASASTQLDLTTWTQAQRCVLFNYPNISAFEQEHLNYLTASKKNSKRALENYHHSNFLDWFVKHVQSLAAEGRTLDTEVDLLSRRPYMMVKKINSYCINGCTFHTYGYGKGKSTQCYGVTTVAATSSFSSAKDKHPVVGNVAYYGRIVDIVELNYSNEGYAVLFKWASLIGSEPRRLQELNSRLKALKVPCPRLHNDTAQTELEQIAESNKRKYYEDLENSRINEDEEEETYVDEEEQIFEDEVPYEDEDEGVHSDEEVDVDEEDAEANEANGTQQVKKKRGDRGPTELKIFWGKYGPNNKIDLTYNYIGQPCGSKTSKLANFAGYLVKGKDVSMGATSWRKVPAAEKEKLWQSIKSFFNVDDSFKPWVLKSASKKWRAFKALLKKNYYDDELSVKENIANGCHQRVKPHQWVTLVKHWSTHKAKVISAINKAARENQQNGTHTSGTRSFAVKQHQMEQEQGRPVGRVELFFETHLKSDGVPVNVYAENKIREAEKFCKEDPTLVRGDDDELYGKMFPDAKKSRRHGMGLVVGGKTSEQIEHLVQLLKQSQDENTHLKGMMQTLATRSGQLEERMEERWKQFLAYQKKIQDGQQELNGEDIGQVAPQQQGNTGVTQNLPHHAQKGVAPNQQGNQQHDHREVALKQQEKATVMQRHVQQDQIEEQHNAQGTLFELATVADQIEKSCDPVQQKTATESQKYKPCFTIYANTRNKSTSVVNSQFEDSQTQQTDDQHHKNKSNKREREDSETQPSKQKEAKKQVQAKMKAPRSQQSEAQVEANMQAPRSQKHEAQVQAKMKAPRSQQSEAQVEANMKAPRSQKHEAQVQAKMKAPRSQKHEAQVQENMKAPRSQHMEAQVQEKLKKVKLEKVAENIAARSVQKKVSLKKGMEVGLTSPNSLQVVAFGTIQNTDEGSDFIEVLVNIVLKDTTILPRSQGRITNLGAATAQCIPWPRKNLVEESAESTVVQQPWRTVGKPKKHLGMKG